MKLAGALIAAFALAALATPAHARLVYATGGADVSITPGTVTDVSGSGFAIPNGKFNGGNGPDGLIGWQRGVLATSSNATIVMVADFYVGATYTGDTNGTPTEVWIWALASSGAVLDSVSYYNRTTGVFANRLDVNIGGSQAIVANRANNYPGTITQVGSWTHGQGYDTIRLTFSVTGLGTGLLTIDTIANPEPGTWALFGLGALGLGGLIRRRKAKKKNAAATPAA